MTIVLERAVELITEKRRKQMEKTIRDFSGNTDMKILKGRYGAYISYKRQNYKIPKSKDPEELTLEDCLHIVKETEPSKPGRMSRKKK
jgi:DNA topoisomerase-1